jgi:HPt (histidine-containing phosphotransfer) domain-containing protein
MADTEPGGVLDPERLADLQQLGPERFKRLVETFVDGASAQVEELIAHVANGDADAVRRVAHSLKGSSRIYGAARVAELAAALETDAGGPANAAQVAQLRSELSAAVDALRSLG